MTDHYSVLGVERGADAAVIKAAYVNAVLECHPDKCSDPSKAARFPEVQAAWEALRNPDSRAQHDLDLAASEQRERQEEASTHVSDEVPISEMDINLRDDGRWFSYRCRCGDWFRLSHAEHEAGVTIVECHSCSLRIRVLYDG